MFARPQGRGVLTTGPSLLLVFVFEIWEEIMKVGGRGNSKGERVKESGKEAGRKEEEGTG